MTTINRPLGSKHHAWSALALAVSLTGAAPVARADTLSDLNERTDALQRRVNELENTQQKTAPSGVVTGGDIPGSFRLPGSTTSIKLGGYVKFDAVYSDITQGVDAVANQQTVDSAIPVGPTGTPADHKRGQLTYHARQTRLNLATSTPPDYGTMTTYYTSVFFCHNTHDPIPNNTPIPSPQS